MPTAALKARARRRWVAIAVWVTAVLLAAGIGFWAGRVALTPAAAAPERPAPVRYTVREDAVGSSVQLVADGQWITRVVGRAVAGGTVTSVDIDADEQVQAGQRILSVDLRPVTAAVGPVPSFRTLQAGVAGPDVAQLQDLLRVTGFEVPRTARFDAATKAAVRRWQAAVGVAPVDGVVPAGDVVYLPTLPARIAPATDVRVGSTIAPGGDLVLGLPATPQIQLKFSSEQLATLPTTGAVTVTLDDKRWPGVLGETRVLPSGEGVTPINAPGGGAVCGEDCVGAIPVGDGTLLGVELSIVPNTRGPVVPAAGITSGPDGTTVTMADGSQRSVQVLTSANGLAVVKGIAAGEVIMLPGSPAG